jgi:PAS domain S-box-containing protein
MVSRDDPIRQRFRPGKLNRAAFLERAIRLLGEGETATGAHVFDRMARLLAAAMGVRWAFVSEVAEAGVHQIRLLGYWSAPTPAEPFEYNAVGTPCEQVLMTGDAVIPNGLLGLFPDFEWGRELGAESYMGAALYGPDQTLLGHIGVMHDEALDEDLPLAAILRIFRERAAGELVRTRTETALRASSEPYRRLVEASPDALFRIRLRPDFAYEYVSPAYERISGHSADELYRDPDLPIREAHPDDRELAMRLRRGEFIGDKWIRRWYRDGKLRWSEQRVIPVYDDQGNVVAVEGIGRDITELMEAKERLEAQEELQRKVLGAIPEQIVRVDRDGTVASVIPTGWKGKPLAKVGQKLRDVVPRKLGAELQRQIAKVLDTNSVGGISFRRAVGGDQQHVEMRLISAPGDEIYCIIRDTTGDVWLAREAEIQGERESLETNVERVLSAHQVYGLSFRELTVLQLIAQGETDRAISHKLGLSLFTVNKHVSNILGKMGVSSRTEASVLAASEGLLT